MRACVYKLNSVLPRTAVLLRLILVSLFLLLLLFILPVSTSLSIADNELLIQIQRSNNRIVIKLYLVFWV